MRKTNNNGHCVLPPHNLRSPATLSQVENISTTSKLPTSQAIDRNQLTETFPHSGKCDRFGFVRVYQGAESCRQHCGEGWNTPPKSSEELYLIPQNPSVQFLPTSRSCFGHRLIRRLKLLRQSGVRFAMPNTVWLASKNGPGMPSRSSSRKSSNAITCGT